MWILLYHFHKIYACGKQLVRLYEFIFSEWLKNNNKLIYKYFKEKYGKVRV